MTISNSIAPAHASATKPVQPDFATSLLCRLALGVCVVLSASAALADDMKMPMNDKEMKWGAAPPVFPKGAQVAVLSGDPFKEGPYVLRLKMPAGYKIAAHKHPHTERITVISGELYFGTGDKLDAKRASKLAPGGFVELPANTNHYAFAKRQTVIQISGEGPFGIEYVNSADDPSKKN